MTAEQQTTTASRPSMLRRGLRILLFRVFPVILVLATGWSLYRVIDAFSTEYSTYNQTLERRDAYTGTATAIAPGLDAGAWHTQPDDLSESVMVAQFVTNTPSSDTGDTGNTGDTGQAGDDSGTGAATDAPADSNNSFLATNTPDAVPTATATLTVAPPAQPTAAPTQAPASQSVPGAGIGYVQPTIIPPSAPEQAVIAGTAVPTQVPLIPRDYELVNILLLGGDDELSDDNSVRTDTMIIVSINTQTESVSMLSLPRDLFVYSPSGTMTRLNTIYSIGEAYNWSGGPFFLLRQAIFYNFGINVHYYAKVDFTGFETIIDALGGVEVAVDCTYRDYYPVEDIDLSRPIEENYELRTLPVGYYKMDGFDALWYARTRRGTTDFERGRRQQRLLKSIFRAALNNGQLQNLPDLWGELTQVVDTNIPFDVVLNLLPIGLRLDPSRIQNYTLQYTYHTTPWTPSEGPFAGQNVQLPVYERVNQLLFDFYQPPTASRLELSGPLVAVYNGTSNPDWDRVATERLRDEGVNAYAAGVAEAQTYTDTALIDYVGTDKGSPVGTIMQALNIGTSNLQVAPDPNREADYEIIIGENYNSCPVNIIDVDQS